MKLAGKVVVITGAAHGLGKALAVEFRLQQAVIVAVDQDERGLAALQNEVPDVVTIKADVTEHQELQQVLDDTLKIHSQLDVWVNNAGILSADGPALEQNITEIRRVFDVNTLALIDGSILAAQYFAEHPGGWIINVLSSTALEVVAGRSMYSASKHAGHGFTQALKTELKSTAVLAVYPEGIKSQLFGQTDEPNYDQFMTGTHVAQRIVQAVRADKVANLVIKR